MAQLDAKKRGDLPKKSFAYVDDAGEGHLPINDEAHVKNAIARFGQTHFAEAEDKTKAAKKIVSAARREGVEVSPASAVAKAAKK